VTKIFPEIETVRAETMAMVNRSKYNATSTDIIETTFGKDDFLKPNLQINE